MHDRFEFGVDRVNRFGVVRASLCFSHLFLIDTSSYLARVHLRGNQGSHDNERHYNLDGGRYVRHGEARCVVSARSKAVGLGRALGVRLSSLHRTEKLEEPIYLERYLDHST